MNSRNEPQPMEPFEVLVLGAGVIFVTALGLTWATAVVAFFLRHGGLLRVDTRTVTSSARRLPDHLADPAGAWPEPFRSQLPGPILYWLAAVIVVAVIGFCVWLYFRIRPAHQEAPDRRRRLGVDVQPRLAKAADMKSLVARQSEPNRLVLGRSRRRDLLMTEPPMFRHGRGVRGAVAVFGPSQSGKTTGLVLSVNEWHGPAIVSSVKTDLMRNTIEARRLVGDVKVFDPIGISGMPCATWSPLRRAKTQDGALAAAHLLASGTGDEGAADKFWRQQAEQLLAAMLWIAANTDGYTMRHVVDWVTTLDRPSAEGTGTLSPLARLLTDHEDPAVAAAAREVRGWLTGQWNADPKTSASIYTTARGAIWPWTDSGVQRSAVNCDITLDWLLDGNNTLYLIAPLGGERRVGQVFSVMMQDLIAEAFERGNRHGPADPSLLVVLDEAANTALPTLPEWAATVTGIGIQLVTVWQSKGQIDRVYGKDADNLLTNHRTKLLYPSGISDLATLDYFEKLIGNEHIRSDLDNPRGIYGPTDRNRAHTPSTAVPFLTPAILRQMRVGDALLIHGALPPAWIKARPNR